MRRKSKILNQPISQFIRETLPRRKGIEIAKVEYDSDPTTFTVRDWLNSENPFQTVRHWRGIGAKAVLFLKERLEKEGLL